jgi:hypothetical protein
MYCWYTLLALTCLVPYPIHKADQNDGHANHRCMFMCVPPRQQSAEFRLELAGKVIDMLAGGFAKDEHLPQMGLSGDMAFETIFVAALLLA